MAVEVKKLGLARVNEAQEFLALSRATVYRLLEAGTLPSVRIGGARRVPWSELLKFAEVKGEKVEA